MKLILLLFSISVGIFTCSAQYKDSLKTFQKLTKSYQKSSDFVFIPPGSFTRGANDSDIPYVGQPRSYTVSVDSFFMEKFEVSNEQYLEFVTAKLKEDSILGKAFLPDTLVWRGPGVWNEPYVDYYLRHPAYGNFPVVGVSYVQAKAYAQWLTEKYNQDEERVFKKVCFRLPTEEEWEFAYKGGLSDFYLPWGSYSTIDHEGKSRANFLSISQLSVYRDSAVVEYNGETKKRPVYLSTGMRMWENSAGSPYFDEVTAPVNTYNPNGYGLYQMAGNVEEMVDAYFDRDPSTYLFAHDLQEAKHETPWGVTKGGSWADTGYYLQYPTRQFYADEHSTSAEIGFRLVMVVLDY